MTDQVQIKYTDSPSVVCPDTSKQLMTKEVPDSLENGPSTSLGVNNDRKKENKFQQAVRRHLGKDKLFHLVTTLLKTIEEENKAQNDLIQSFQTARNIKIDVPKVKRTDGDFKPKRRRKKSEIPLIEMIETKRKAKDESGFQAEEKALVTNGIVGTLDLTSKHSISSAANRPDSASDAKETDQKGEKNSVFIDMANVSTDQINANDDACSEHKHDDHTVGQELESTDNDKTTIDGNKLRIVPRTALITEKEVVIDHFRSKDDNFDLDKLVLESVLENTCLSTENIDRNEGNPDTVVDGNADSDHNEEASFQVAVESDSDTEEGDSETDIKGKCDVFEESFEIIDMNDQTTDNKHQVDENADNEDFGKFLATNQHVTSSEYSRMPSTILKPSLTPISEAEHSGSSFRSLYGRSSSSIIDIESNQATLDKLNKPLDTTILKTQHDDVRPKAKHIRKSKTRFNDANDTQVDETKQLSNHADNIPTKDPSRLLYIDLLDVYNCNEDLQKINLGQSIKSKHSKVQTKRYITSSNLKEGPPLINDIRRQRRSVSAKPLPMFPKSIKQSRRSHSVGVSSDDDRPSNEHVEHYQSYLVRKETERYRQPDMVLWSHLRILETSPQRAYSSNTHRQNSSESFTLINRHTSTRNNSTARRSSSRRHKSARQYRMLDMPLYEAVKNVGHIDQMKVPPLQALQDSRPRRQRVKQLYTDLRQDRSDYGYRQCKCLDLSLRTNSFVE